MTSSLVRVRSSRVIFLLVAVLASTTAIRLVLSWEFFGFSTGDDVEILQAGFSRAFGLASSPWELRHLLLPDLLVAPVLRLVSAMGAESTSIKVWAASVPFVVLATLNIFLVFRIGVRWLGDERPALLAAYLYGFHWIPLGYGSTVYPRTATTFCVLLAVVLISTDSAGWWRPALAGGMLALAFAFRFSEVIYFLPCLVLVVITQGQESSRWIRAAALGVGLVVVAALVVGVEDWLTWGRPYASIENFFRYTIVDKNASALVPNQPWFWYFWRLPKWLPLTLLPFFFVPQDRDRGFLLRPLLFIVLPLAVLSVIHHKELRYLQGVAPFFCLAGAGSAWEWWQDGRRRVTVLLLALSMLLGITGLTFLSKTSMAAVIAARDLAANPNIQKVALSQSWAYGSNLFLDDVQILGLGVSPTLEELKRVAPGRQAIALYQDVVEGSPELAVWLLANGFSDSETYRYSRSRPVIVYRSGE